PPTFSPISSSSCCSSAATRSAVPASPCFFSCSSFFFNAPPTPAIYTLSLHDALPIWPESAPATSPCAPSFSRSGLRSRVRKRLRSEEHTSELQSRFDLVCRLLLEKKKSDLTAAGFWSRRARGRCRGELAGAGRCCGPG